MVKGDLQVAAIVSPTNDERGLTGGAADHVAEAAGLSYKKDCKALLASSPDGSFSGGDTAISGASPCKHINHAVTPLCRGELVAEAESDPHKHRQLSLCTVLRAVPRCTL